jgi:hypothetical protein
LAASSLSQWRLSTISVPKAAVSFSTKFGRYTWLNAMSEKGRTGTLVAQNSSILLKNSQNTAPSGIFIPNIVGTLDHAFNI